MSLTFGNNTQVRPVRISDIHMDVYQRKVDQKRVKMITDHYDVDRDRPVELSRRNGRYYCFDGQHRVAAHRILGDEYILAQIHYNLSFHDEARLFAEQHNNESRVSVADRWKAAINAGSAMPDVLEITRICKAHGYTIDCDNVTKSNMVFRCVTELQDIYNRHGKNGLVTMLSVLMGAWYDIKCATHREIVGGIKKIMDTYGEQLGDAEWNRLAKKLSKVLPRRVLDESRVYPGRGSKQTALYMVDCYNRGLRETNRLNPLAIK